MSVATFAGGPAAPLAESGRGELTAVGSAVAPGPKAASHTARLKSLRSSGCTGVANDWRLAVADTTGSTPGTAADEGATDTDVVGRESTGAVMTLCVSGWLPHSLGSD